MNTSDTDYKKCLIETLKQLISFCNSNNIEYCLGAGSCLGAVRHHGIIPWDDDIDVFMKRAEIEKLISLRKNIPDGYNLILMNENGYSYPIPKFYNSNTTIWEDKSIETIIGVYVDIFPLDECPSDIKACKKIKKEYTRAYSKYMDCTRKWVISDFFEKIVHFHPLGLIRITKNVLLRPFKDYYLNKYYCISNRIKKTNGTNIADFDGAYMAFYPKSIFEKTIEVDFEGIKVKIPEEFDAYLTITYNNYMELPPIEKRESHHSRYFINLKEGMTLDEVKMIKCSKHLKSFS